MQLKRGACPLAELTADREVRLHQSAGVCVKGTRPGQDLEVAMTVLSRRTLIAVAALSLAVPGAALADSAKEIRIDWATYNPVSMLLKEKGFLEKEFAKDGIKVTWVKTVSS